MKTIHTDRELQEAIDTALDKTYTASKAFVTKRDYPRTWSRESKARLDLARAFLANLPEIQLPVVDGKTPGQVTFEAFQGTAFQGDATQWSISNYRESWEAAASAVLAAFGNNRLPVPAEKPDSYAELRKAHAEGKVIQYNVGSDARSDWEDINYTQFRERPECYRIKPDPLVTKSDSSPEWTPQAGDVVRLKSGGPLMTVGKVSDEAEIFCFRGDDLMKTSIPTACLELSSKVNAQ